MASPLIPLFIVAVVVGIACLIGYVVFSIAQDIANKTHREMEKRNISIGKDGAKISVKHLKEEDYVGQTQSILVKAWNLSTWPAYKSRLWNKQAQGQPANGQATGSQKTR